MKNRVFKMTEFSLAALLGLVFSMPVLAADEAATDQTVEQAKDEKGDWHRKHKERWENMTEEERAAHRAKRKEMREKIANMSPEERRAFFKQRMEEKMANMTPEQKERFQKRHAEKIKRYDTDGDGELNDAEWQAMRDAKKAKRLEKFDTNGDGEISDEERAAAKEAWKNCRDKHMKRKDKEVKAERT